MGRPCIYPKAITREARDKAYRYFAVALKKFGKVDAYWLAGSERVAVRVAEPRRGRANVGLPASAIYIGRFSHPHSPSVFVNDLDAMLAQKVA